MDPAVDIDIPVGKTALYTCSERALEQGQSNSLFSDPNAELLAGKIGQQMREEIHGLCCGYRKESANISIVIRTAFFDDVIRYSVDSTNLTQLVIIAAGMDTRVDRLALPAEIYELDFPQVLNFKAQRLGTKLNAKGIVHHHLIGVDLTKHWHEKLVNEGYDPSLPSVWLVEGLLVYLQLSEIKTLLETISGVMTPGSLLIGDWFNKSYMNCSN